MVRIRQEGLVSSTADVLRLPPGLIRSLSYLQNAYNEMILNIHRALVSPRKGLFYSEEVN